MMTHPLPVAGKLAMKALDAKQLQTTQIHIQTWISAHRNFTGRDISLQCTFRQTRNINSCLQKIKFSHYSTISYMCALTQ